MAKRYTWDTSNDGRTDGIEYRRLADARAASRGAYLSTGETVRFFRVVKSSAREMDEIEIDMLGRALGSQRHTTYPFGRKQVNE